MRPPTGITEDAIFGKLSGSVTDEAIQFVLGLGLFMEHET